MNIYISRCYANLTTAGNKAKTDIEQIMTEEGFYNVGLPQRIALGKLGIFFYNLGSILSAMCKMRRGDLLWLQYPVKKYYTALCRCAHLRGARTVTLIHDLGSCRRKKLTPAKEISRLSLTDFTIATNDVMGAKLREMGYHGRLDALGLWDYLTNAYPRRLPRRPCSELPRIVYAGGLSRRKNAFIYKWPDVIEGYVVHLYGHGFHPELMVNSSAFTDHGFVPAEQFLRTVDCDFGLVWDGDSIDTCSGDFGEYLAVNTPHKLSLYLRAGIPVIVWSRSAVADIVIREGIGFVIDSLQQIPQRLRSLSTDRQDLMRERACAMGVKIGRGEFFRAVMHRALRHLEKNE